VLALSLWPASAAAVMPRPDHVVVVVMENRDYGEVIGASSAPYINGLAAQGALFTASYAVALGSEPNYRALFSGATQGDPSGSCPETFPAENLGHELAVAGLSFAGFSESMPSDGFTGCASGSYVRAHNPWVDFSNVAPGANLTFADFPLDYSRLPTVAFVSPNLCDDMHDCPVGTGDSWLQANMDGYVQWAKSHNSLLVLTWDEGGATGGTNQIATLFVGAHVRPGQYGETISHYSVLRTLEDMYGLPYAGQTTSVTPITDIWSAGGGGTGATGGTGRKGGTGATGGTGGTGGAGGMGATPVIPVVPRRPRVRLALAHSSLRTLVRARGLLVYVRVDQSCTVSVGGSLVLPAHGRTHRSTLAIGRRRLAFTGPGWRSVRLLVSQTVLRALRGWRNAQFTLSATCRNSFRLTSSAALRGELR
jgi:phosphatidylinositol-3-phosphatase